MPSLGRALMPTSSFPSSYTGRGPDSLPGLPLPTPAAKGRAGTVLGLRPSPHDGHEAATERWWGAKCRWGRLRIDQTAEGNQLAQGS